MRFVLIGIGYVAPRHMKAIKDIGGELVAAFDPHDSVGVLDSFFPGCSFFTEFERFERFCEKEKREGRPIDYVSICSPNYLHDSHCRFALRMGADAICEKPLVLKTKNINWLKEIEEETGNRIWCVSQLRVHPEAHKMPRGGVHDITINYITPRGKWYHFSWKGDIIKSGGLCFNIGFHMFDLCSSVYGKMVNMVIDSKDNNHVKGFLKLEDAYVNFLLSIEGEKQREFLIDGKQYKFDYGFDDLHTMIYKGAVANNGTSISDVSEAIRICEAIRND